MPFANLRMQERERGKERERVCVEDCGERDIERDRGSTYRMGESKGQNSLRLNRGRLARVNFGISRVKLGQIGSCAINKKRRDWARKIPGR